MVHVHMSNDTMVPYYMYHSTVKMWHGTFSYEYGYHGTMVYVPWYFEKYYGIFNYGWFCGWEQKSMRMYLRGDVCERERVREGMCVRENVWERECV